MVTLGRRKALLLSLLALVLVGVPAVDAVMSSYRTIHNTGSMKAIGVGIFQDSGCTQALTTVDWGTLEPSSVKNVTMYVKNTGNAPGTLSLQTGNWSPADASSYLMLSWNYNNVALTVNEVRTVELTLSVSAGITGITGFSFDITIASNG